ncbi:hypothetical protein N7445_002609 [Penicillium cf. griseofulvum]|nr:hypothetical protein N7445_002609 [Penicillium cf. griseofulvum]
MIPQIQYSSCSDSTDSLEKDNNPEEYGFLSPNIRDKWGTRSNLWRQALSVTIFVLLAVLVILNGILLFWVKSSLSDPNGPSQLNYFLYSPSGEKKHPEIVEQIYHDYHDDFLNFNTTISQQHWRSLFPVGEGMIGLTDQQVIDMDVHHSVRGVSDPDRHIYMVAVFHQLHCLSQARSIIMHLFQDPEYTIREATYHHTMHCVDIVRQALMCASDSTLIWKEYDIKWPGEGGTRVCRNFDALTEWVIDHQYVSQSFDPALLPHTEY